MLTSARPPSIKDSARPRPHREPGRRAQPRLAPCGGFTLVEILVVVVIMAVVISLAVLSIGTTGRDGQLDEETRRIEGLVSLLHERALLEGRDFGIRIEPTAYEFVAYQAFRDRWETMDQEREFRHRELPKGLSFQLQLDSQTVVLKAVDSKLSSSVKPAPQVAIAASGEGTPFRLILQRDETKTEASVVGDALGKVSPRKLEFDRQAHMKSRGQRRVPVGAHRGAPVPTRGFTLVEVLVALMVVAMGLAALMVAVSGTARTSGYLRDKTLAQWIAMNRLTEVRLNSNNKFAQNTDAAEVEYAGRTWHYDTRYFDTSIATMKRVVVRVYAGDAKAKGNPLAESHGFPGHGPERGRRLQPGLDQRQHRRLPDSGWGRSRDHRRRRSRQYEQRGHHD